MIENNERTFDLETVLTVTTGRLFTNLDNLYDILDYLSNDEIYSHQIPRVINTAGAYVLQKYPQLDGVGKDVVLNNEQDIKTFLDSQKEVYGDSFGLSPMPEELCQHIDPIEEILEMRSGKAR